MLLWIELGAQTCGITSSRLENEFRATSLAGVMVRGTIHFFDFVDLKICGTMAENLHLKFEVQVLGGWVGAG